MDAAGLSTAEYRQLLIQATGEITSDVLDAEVALGGFALARESRLSKLTRRSKGTELRLWPDPIRVEHRKGTQCIIEIFRSG